MRNVARMAGAAALTVLVVACGPRATGSVASESRVTTSPSVLATTTVTPCGASNRCLALVTLRGSDQVVIRDVTDIAHPKTVGTVDHLAAQSGRFVRVDWGQEATAPLFRSGSMVTFAVPPDMLGVPVGGQADRLPPPYPGIQQYAWSPDGAAIVLDSGEQSTSASTSVFLLMNVEGANSESPATWFKRIGTIPVLGAGGCEALASCNIPNFLDVRLLYSPDGTRISLVINSFAASVFRVWAADGTLLKSDDGRGWTMSVWSGSGLYFRGSDGVSVLRNGSISTFLPGVAWIKPSASPGGGRIVYSARDSAGWAHTYVVDTGTGKVRELNKARTGGVFLTSRFIWYQGERACLASENCGSSPAIHPLSGKSYIYDLQDGTETESLITGVFDVWPHAA